MKTKIKKFFSKLFVKKSDPMLIHLNSKNSTPAVQLGGNYCSDVC